MILFRGQGEKSEWVYGFYVYEKFSNTSIILRNNDLGYYRTTVNSETIGQYVGLNDSDGKKIFMGDILEYRFQKKISFLDNKSKISPGMEWIEIGFQKGCFCKRIIKQKNSYFGKIPSSWESLFFSRMSNYKIIGNIWDNPELLIKE